MQAPVKKTTDREYEQLWAILNRMPDKFSALAPEPRRKKQNNQELFEDCLNEFGESPF